MRVIKRFFSVSLATMLFILAGYGAVVAAPKGMHTPNPNNEYKVGAIAWQLSAESHALMEQAFTLASQKVKNCMDKCLDPNEPDWIYDADANAMYYKDERVAVISDIDDTLVDGIGYSCDVIGNNGDYNNVAFARFVMSDSCTACPGAVEFVKTCEENGIEVYYISNRSDRGYVIDRYDSKGSYEQAVGDTGGLYIDAEGNEIGASIWQCVGKSFYDITLESMQKLGFPIDDQHLILNDTYLYGNSKEPARQAVINGSDAFPNGQREGENTSGSSLFASIQPHYVIMMLGDNLGDFTDAFSADGLDAVSRAELVGDYSDKFGTEWIVLPNAVYGTSYSYAEAYGLSNLLRYYSYLPE